MVLPSLDRPGLTTKVPRDKIPKKIASALLISAVKGWRCLESIWLSFVNDLPKKSSASPEWGMYMTSKAT
jgi:hypothetical protein